MKRAEFTEEYGEVGLYGGLTALATGSGGAGVVAGLGASMIFSRAQAAAEKAARITSSSTDSE